MSSFELFEQRIKCSNKMNYVNLLANTMSIRSWIWCKWSWIWWKDEEKYEKNNNNLVYGKNEKKKQIQSEWVCEKEM